MERLFAFTNIALHYFWEFTEKSFIDIYFVDLKLFNRLNYQELIDNRIQYFQDSLTNFNNEIIQIVQTTNQETIDYYFKELKGYIERINQITKEELLGYINDFNNEAYKSFIEKVKKNEKEYFEKGERKLYKHLEEYEFTSAMTLLYGGGYFGPKTKSINYNFYCIEDIPPLADLKYFDDYFALLMQLKLELIDITKEDITLFENGKIKADVDKFYNKTIVYVEGEHDIKYINKAVEILNLHSFLEKIEIRQRGGYKNLDKIWDFYKGNSIEIIPQKKILLYDCDTSKQDEDFGDYLFKRVIPVTPSNPIQKGIENVFNKETIDKAIKYKSEFIDIHEKKSVIRGKEEFSNYIEVNKDEKTNFCNWLCENGNKEDFENMKIIFKIIYQIIKNDFAT